MSYLSQFAQNFWVISLKGLHPKKAPSFRQTEMVHHPVHTSGVLPTLICGLICPLLISSLFCFFLIKVLLLNVKTLTEIALVESRRLPHCCKNPTLQSPRTVYFPSAKK